MTGYAAIRNTAGSGELQISIRSVNHRALDLHFNVAATLAGFENAMRTMLKENIARGHVEVRAYWTGESAQDAVEIDESVLGSYVNTLKSVARKLGIETMPELSAMLALPGVILTRPAQLRSDALASDEVLNQFAACIREVNDCREREGAALVKHISDELAEIEIQTATAARLRKGCVQAMQQNIRERLSALLTESGVSEARVIEEAAILADRSDVQEELTRLAVHTAELRRILQNGGEVGKRIDFLLQEMNRETNTLLSKSSGAGELGLQITNAGLELKAHIEKIREQALNLE